MRAHAWAGHYDRAIEGAPVLLVDSGRHPWALGLLAWTYGKAGRTDRAQACYDELEARSRHEFVLPAWLSATAASAGLHEVSLSWLVRAVAERDALVLWPCRLPFWDAVRSDPRFVEIMKTVWG